MSDWTFEQDGIIATYKDKVATVRIDKPETKNGMDSYAILAMAQAYERIAAEADARVLVYRGSGRYFFTGGRVDANDPDDRKRYADSQKVLSRAMEKVHLPEIAAVNGDCFKGGMGFLAEADMAIAKISAKFSFPEIRMGGVPMIVMAQCIRMPKKLLMEMLYSSEEFDAETMYRMGLLNAVTGDDDDDFEATLDRYIHKIIDYPQSLIQMTHDYYYSMAAITDDRERISFAEKNLAEVVLPQMAKEKQEYNV